MMQRFRLCVEGTLESNHRVRLIKPFPSAPLAARIPTRFSSDCDVRVRWPRLLGHTGLRAGLRAATRRWRSLGGPRGS